VPEACFLRKPREGLGLAMMGP
jgi:hypothetical protein